jgi:hypothetical protein
LIEKNKKFQNEVEQLQVELNKATKNLNVRLSAHFSEGSSFHDFDFSQDANLFIASLKQELIISYKKAKFFETENAQLQSKLFYYQTQQSTAGLSGTELLPPAPVDANTVSNTSFSNFLSSFDNEPGM